MVKVGTASKDENGKYQGGAAGDQTGKEVYIRDWYNFGYTYVLRCKDPAVAERIAKQCEAGCNNNNIGYDMTQRNTAYTVAKLSNYDLSKINKPCETDCSAFATLCAICAGIKQLEYTANAPTTVTMVNAFKNTGMFDVLTDKIYLTSDKYLKRGDILVRPGHHTVTCLTDGEKARGKVPAAANNNAAAVAARPTIRFKDTDKSLGGEYVTAWQRYLSMAGFYRGRIDGIYGSLMLEAVIAYQKANKLTPDGIIGVKTWGTLPK